MLLWGDLVAAFESSTIELLSLRQQALGSQGGVKESERVVPFEIDPETAEVIMTSSLIEFWIPTSTTTTFLDRFTKDRGQSGRRSLSKSTSRFEQAPRRLSKLQIVIMRKRYGLVFLLDFLVCLAYVPAPFFRRHGGARAFVVRLSSSTDHNIDDNDNDDPLALLASESTRDFSKQRRALLAGTLATQALLLSIHPASAATAAINPILSRLVNRPSSLYVVSPEKNVTATPQREPLFSEPYYLSSEICLLKLLPVKNPLFRSLETSITSLSNLETLAIAPDAWPRATKTMEDAIAELDNKRGKLAPVFNPEDSTLLAISKGERGERLIEDLRRRMVRLVGSTKAANLTQTLNFQKDALLALSEVGELLVAAFPYDVPTEGKYSYLPRLLGRAKVTFTFRRKFSILGNVTIIADGFTAPISAGNFLDLSIRNFYTGLPIKFTRRRIGAGTDFDVANLPVLGSFQEGFYDPLTAKPRRIPLEIIRVEKSNGTPILSYSQGLTELSLKPVRVLEPTSASRPLLSFNIPGIVALNHPDGKENGASSEFFALQDDSVLEDKRKLLDGSFAPFGYIVEGYELFNKLKPGDVIDNTYVDEWGMLNLVKLRRSSFSEVVQGSGDKNVTADE